METTLVCVRKATTEEASGISYTLAFQCPERGDAVQLFLSDCSRELFGSYEQGKAYPFRLADEATQ